MDTSSLSSYLASARRNLEKIKKAQLESHVVMGNESADLDSVISSIVMGYYVAHSLSKGGKDPLVFSVINVNREDLALRTESVYFLKQNGIQMDQLISRDEIDLDGLQKAGNLKLYLVDHNALSTSQSHLDKSVFRVVDHHKLERKLGPDDIVEVVGSCCTHVAPIVLGDFGKDPLVCLLLYGTIVLDTVNFSDAAGKTTPKDLKVTKDLETALSGSPNGVPDRTELFNALVQARSDVSQLTPAQLLRKDTKDVRFDQISISVPSIPMSSDKFLRLPNIGEHMKSYTKGRRVDAVVILCIMVESSGDMKRDVIVYSASQEKGKEICGALENSDLKLEFIQSKDSVFTAYKQKNVGHSRKYVIPRLEEHFNKDKAKGDKASGGGKWFGGYCQLL